MSLGVDRALAQRGSEKAPMNKPYDVVVRGGLIADGSGSAPYLGDVAIRDGHIAAVGCVSGEGREELCARDKLVTPGFVDVHTHYDGQATWTERMQPSSWHGVTTVVMGNCGVGFAPCKPADHDRLIRLMEGVEDIPFPVLAEGLPWNWQSYPDYLDSLATREFDVDIGSQLPHAALRVFVMGERGAAREPATPSDIAEMAAIAKSAVEAGALGFSTSRTLNHRTSDGQPTPTLTASEEELTAIALGLASANQGAGLGVLQFVSDFSDPVHEFAMLRRLVECSGRPLSFSLVQSPRARDQWRYLLDELSSATAAGLAMTAQVCGRPVGILLGLELTLHPFLQCPSYREISKLPLSQRVLRLRDPQLRAQLLSEKPADLRGVSALTRRWESVFLMEAAPDYEQPPERCIAALAATRGQTPEQLALDHLLSNDGRGMLYLPLLNYPDGSLDTTHTMWSHPDTISGLSDGGAHVGTICDGSVPTSNLTHWTRDRSRGPKLALEHVVRMQTRKPAEALHLFDRGVLLPGYRADLNVIDYDALQLRAPHVAYDLPAAGRRLLQRAVGYSATLVAGQITYRDGEPSGALPGRLLRGPQPSPTP
jgi:N-acyl-D-aspartate/D-glutamate deacylase